MSALAAAAARAAWGTAAVACFDLAASVLAWGFGRRQR